MVAVLIQRRNFITALYNQLHKSPLCTLTSPPPPLTQPPLANTSRHMLNLSNKLIETTVTNQASQVENWLTQLTSLHQTPPLIVGIDCEWKPQWTKGAKINKVALLQLCVDDKCLLFQLLHMDYIPLMLKEFLNDANVTVVGVGLKYDLGRLKTCYDIDCGCGIEEINALVAKSRGCSYNLRSLKDLALDVLGVDVVKKKSITMSNWAARVLKPGQIEYASLDAVLSYQMGYKLLKNRLIQDDASEVTGNHRDNKKILTTKKKPYPVHGTHKAALRNK